MREIQLLETFLGEAAEYVREKYSRREMITVASKGDPSDLLTEVDLTVQKRFVEALHDAFPTDLVVGEEGAFSRLPDDPNVRAWVIDPLDGTYNFVRGMTPVFGVSVAFVELGLARAAGVVFPLSGDLFLAEQGSGSYRNGARLRVSEVQHLEEACIEVDFSTIHDRRAFVSRAVSVMRQAGQIRCLGAAVGGICQVATGDADGYLHMSLYPWDYAAAQLIAEEAGAMATRLDGSPLRVFDGREGVLVTNGAVHDAILGLITP